MIVQPAAYQRDVVWMGRVAELARRYEGRVSYMQHIEERPPRMKSPKEEIVYYRIADHYRCTAQPPRLSISVWERDDDGTARMLDSLLSSRLCRNAKQY